MAAPSSSAYKLLNAMDTLKVIETMSKYVVFFWRAYFRVDLAREFSECRVINSSNNCTAPKGR